MRYVYTLKYTPGYVPDYAPNSQVRYPDYTRATRVYFVVHTSYVDTAPAVSWDCFGVSERRVKATETVALGNRAACDSS